MIGILLKLVFFVIIGYLISIGINAQRKNKEQEILETNFNQELTENYFPEFQSEVEAVSSIKGLKIQQQKLIPNIKPRFYFNLDNQTTKDDIKSFLESLPLNFATNVPALKISIEDTRLKDIYFYKTGNMFQLCYRELDTIYPLGSTNFLDLAEKIFTESKVYNFQTVSVESIIIPSKNHWQTAFSNQFNDCLRAKITKL